MCTCALGRKRRTLPESLRMRVPSSAASSMKPGLKFQRRDQNLDRGLLLKDCPSTTGYSLPGCGSSPFIPRHTTHKRLALCHGEKGGKGVHGGDRSWVVVSDVPTCIVLLQRWQQEERYGRRSRVIDVLPLWRRKGSGLTPCGRGALLQICR